MARVQSPKCRFYWEKNISHVRNPDRVQGEVPTVCVNDSLTRLLCIVVSAVFACSLFTSVAAGEGENNVTDWTLAIYIDSDNDLDIWAQEDVNQMLSVGSTESVDVVLLWDTETGPANVYHVLDDGLQELNDCELHGIETNMGDAETLRKFVSYVDSNFESQRFLLALWDHGDDSLGVCFDYHTETDVDIDYLTHQEVISALSDFKVDVLLFAACILAMMEVAYEYSASEAGIDYIVASEGYDPMPGFPWDSILTKLTAEPSMTSLALAKTLVDEHVSYYSIKHRGEVGPHVEGGDQYLDDPGTAWWFMSYEHVTFSVIDVSGIDNLVSHTRDLTTALMLEMEDYAGVVSNARARAVLPWSQNGWERIVDFPTLVETIRDRSQGAIMSACENVMMSLPNALIYYRSVEERSGYEGIGVLFPRSLSMFENCQVCVGQWPMPQWPEFYGQMLFADEVWLDFLNSYWNVASSD
jgi:hypothetical protein